VNIRHHRHQYHIITATTVANTRYHHRKGNTATRSPYYPIAITHRAHASVRILATKQAPTHPYNIHLTFSSLLRHGSIRILLDIVLPQMSYLFPTSRSYFDILLVSPTPPSNEPPPSSTPCSIGVPIMSYPHTQSRVGMCYRHWYGLDAYTHSPLRTHTASVYHHCRRCVHVHHGESR